MNEYIIELSICSDDDKYIELLNLNETELQDWKIALEERALSAFYNADIKLESKKTKKVKMKP